MTKHPYEHDPEVLENAKREPLACLGGCDRLRWLEDMVRTQADALIDLERDHTALQERYAKLEGEHLTMIRAVGGERFA